MDKMLENGKAENHLDTGWTLAPENEENPEKAQNKNPTTPQVTKA